MTAAKTATSKIRSDKLKDLTKTSSSPSVGVDSTLVDKAVNALLKYHEKTTSEQTLSLLGNDRPISVIFTLLRAPKESRPKPIPIVVPHPFFKTFLEPTDGDSGSNNDFDADEDEQEEPEICLIVKEESKPWCQQMIAKFPNHMGGIKKVLGLESLRKKHCGTYEQRRQLLHKYNMFMADDRILPMLSKLLGKAFIESKRLPVPVSITRETALPFAIQKALTSTYMTLNKGNCVSVRAGHTGMKADHLVSNVLAIVGGGENGGAVHKLPRQWANVQMIGIKTADSALLPLYNQTPEALKEIAEMAGLSANVKIVTKAQKSTTTSSSKKQADQEQDKKSKKKRELKSPLLKALKKQKRDDDAKEKSKVDKKQKEEESKSNSSKQKESSTKPSDDGDKTTKKSKKSRLSTDDDNAPAEEVDEKPSKKSKKMKSSSKEKADKTDIGSGKEASAVKEPPKEFVSSKKFRGSQKGYVFRMGPKGLGYYIDVKPVVNPMALEAIMRMGSNNRKGHGSSSGSRRSGSSKKNKNKFRGTRQF